MAFEWPKWHVSKNLEINFINQDNVARFSFTRWNIKCVQFGSQTNYLHDTK